MQVTNIAVSTKPYGTVFSGDYGKQRVRAVLDRADLDDYFEKSWPHLDNAQRRILVEGKSAER